MHPAYTVIVSVALIGLAIATVRASKESVPKLPHCENKSPAG